VLYFSFLSGTDVLLLLLLLLYNIDILFIADTNMLIIQIFLDTVSVDL